MPPSRIIQPNDLSVPVGSYEFPVAVFQPAIGDPVAVGRPARAVLVGRFRIEAHARPTRGRIDPDEMLGSISADGDALPVGCQPYFDWLRRTILFGSSDAADRPRPRVSAVRMRTSGLPEASVTARQRPDHVRDSARDVASSGPASTVDRILNQIRGNGTQRNAAAARRALGFSSSSFPGRA
jgi:hypothetical protein